MFFMLSKILWALVNPGNLLLLLLILGAVLLWTRWRRFGRWLVGFCTVAFLVLAVVPVGMWALGILENRFPPLVDLPGRVDGIIVAGGIVDPVTSRDRGQLSIGGAAERVYEMAVLLRRYPKARLVFSGGSGSLLYQEYKEAEAVVPLLRQLGVDTGRVIFEDQSRNTAENATLSYRMVQPKKGVKPWCFRFILILPAASAPWAVPFMNSWACCSIGWTAKPTNCFRDLDNTHEYTPC
jgi:uncharacterized SAM-binding protein YcdF (DUF218 family)